MQKKQNSKNKPKVKVSKQMVCKAPVASTRVRMSQVPRIKNLRNEVHVNHREFVADILGSINFSSAQSFPINPGMVFTFPWLASIATRFESYKFNKLRFLYETAAPTSTTGSVILAVDYDPADLAPATKTQALSYKSSVRSSPWQDCSFTSESNDLRKRSNYFTRNSVVSTSDIQLYDVGNLYVCVSGQAAATAVGELYVEYDVVLTTPQLESLTGFDRYIASAGGSDASNPFGTSQVIRGGLPINVAPPDGGTLARIKFNSIGDYLLNWVVGGTGLAVPGFNTGTSVTNGSIGFVANAAGTTMVYTSRVKVSGTSDNYLEPITAAWTTVTSSRLYITPCVYTDFA